MGYNNNTMAMKKLQRYVLKDTLKGLVPAFVTLLLIMVVGSGMQLLYQGLDVVRLRSLLPPLMAYSVPMVMPAAFLTAVIMTFGRLTADNELIGIRAAGIHLASIVYPVLLAALLLTLLTAYFQFELVPRARVAIERMKYTAFRQILLDNVALSSRRQLSFRPAYIQYDDFAGGRMKNLFLLEMRGRQPRIITAESATVQPDPNRPEIVQFHLYDCMVSDLSLQEQGRAGTTTAREMRSAVRVGPGPEELTRDEKQMPTRELFAYLRELRGRVAGQEPIERPREVRTELRDRRRLLQNQIAYVARHVERLQQRHHRHAVEEPTAGEELMRNHEMRLEEARAQVETLQQQQHELVQRIGRLREAGSAETDYDRLVELQNQQRTLREQTEAREEDISRLEAEIQEVRRSLVRSRERAEQVELELDEVKRHREKLIERRDEVASALEEVEDQNDLISVRLRIHKRLAQALSLFVFALVGIPLGIGAGGRSVMIAFGLSFGLVLLVFYPILMFGQTAARAGAMPVAPAMWAGNIFVGVIGLALTARVLLK